MLFRCEACTHQFVYPPVTQEDQAEIYSDAYFAAGGDWACGTFAGGYSEAERDLVAEAEAILKVLPESEGWLLDVGCAGGAFMAEAQRAGFRVTGLELNEAQANAARARGLEVITGRIEDVSGPRGPFDVVTLLDCLEHIPAPLSALQKVAAWLRPSGVVFIRGPLANSRIGRIKESLRRITGPQKQLPGYPLDANAFNPRSLATLLLKSGFDRPVWATKRADFGQVWARKL
jgi:SAM-dependent methyltransferase